MAVAIAAGAGVAAVLPATAVAQNASRPGLQEMTLHTVPRAAGVRVRLRGQTFRTDGRGRVNLRLRVFRRARATGRGYLAFAPPEVLPTRLPGGVEARFGGFYERGRVIALSFYVNARVEFIDLQGRSVPPDRVGPVNVKSRTGVRVRFRGGRPVKLHASRVTPFQDGVKSKSIEYAVEGVEVGGANVVNRAQLRFFPLRTRRLTIPLLLYSARFTSHDAIFGFPLGTAVELTYPSGRLARLPLRAGEAEASALPRGEYQVRADGSGFSFERPVSLSRDQVVDLEVISYLDLGMVFGGGLVLAVALVLVRRPAMRRRVRRLLRWAAPRRATSTERPHG